MSYREPTRPRAQRPAQSRGARFPEGPPRIGLPKGNKVPKLGKPKPKPQPKPDATPGAPFPGYGAMAGNQVAGLYDPVLGEYARLIAERQRQYQADAAAKRQAYEAFAKWYLANGPKQVQDVYSGAAKNQSAFAQGFALGDQIIARQLQDQANKQITNAGGASAGQLLHTGPEQANVTYMLGGMIPSGMLNQQGAAFAAAAALQPPAIMAEGGRLAAEIEKAGVEDVAKLRFEEAKLRSEQAKAVFDRAEQLRAEGQAKKAARLEAAQKRAEYLTDKTGWVYVVKNGKPFKTKRRSADYIEAAAKASKPERISISLSESYGVLVDVNGQVVKGKNGKPIPYVPYQPPSRSGGGSSKGGGGGTQSSNRYYFLQTADGIYKVDKRTGKMTKVKGAAAAPGGGGAGGLTDPDTNLPLTRAEIRRYKKDVVDTITDARKAGDTIAGVVAAFADPNDPDPIPRAIWEPIVARSFGVPINSKNIAALSYEKLWKLAIIKGFVPGPGAVDRIGGGVSGGRKSDPGGKGASRKELIDFIRTARGKAKAAATGGSRTNVSYPLPTSPGGGSEFTYVDPEGAPDSSGTRHHAAKDWFAPGGSPVTAPEAGRIVEVTPSRGNSGQIFGGVVKVQTADGRVWVFRHVDPRSVRVGQSVRPGQLLATVTNWASGSSHAHIELWRTLAGGYRYENMIDPMSFFGRSRSGTV